MPVVGRAFFCAPAGNGSDHAHADEDDGDGIKEAPFLCVLPPVLTAIGCLVLFFYADSLYQLLTGMVNLP
jgi:multicomponent Na+:H+ antiporter subunit D